jgi:ornithine cyclodeaminase
MIYLSDEHIKNMDVSWDRVLQAIGHAISTVHQQDFRQPVKPYLRYRNPVNRIIAMPAFLGGSVNSAGIKWIASFPGNIDQGLSRAHSVTILNEADTGIPYCIINTNQISAIRTAGVTGLMIQEYLHHKGDNLQPLEIGMTGFGPIGRVHLAMLAELWSDSIGKIRIFDIRHVDSDYFPASIKDKIAIVDSWEEAYANADIFITCTVSSAPYVNKAPKKGSLQANVSLRDYQPAMKEYMDRIIVDDWEEICRERTDIEMMHKEVGLQKEDTRSFTSDGIKGLFSELHADDTIMFNPMGMAVFDIAVAHLYYQEARTSHKEILLA